jgi:ABC-type nitrate/sulfonate/bicarbonate transport system ATPase subunit
MPYSSPSSALRTAGGSKPRRVAADRPAQPSDDRLRAEGPPAAPSDGASRDRRPPSGPLVDIRIDEKRFIDGDSGRGRLVLDRIRFELAPGELVALLGPSGCGKSTLLQIVAGLDREFVGRIRWPGIKADHQPRLGYVFQNPRLLPWLSVRDNVALVLDHPSAHAARINSLLDAMGLADFRRLHANRLSVGMQRRAALARAFVVEPHLLLMDEPFVSLDAPTANQLRGLLLDVWHAGRSNVLFVTHDLREATMLADRILFLSAPPARVIHEEAVGLPRESRKDQEAVTERHGELSRVFDALYCPGA